MFFDDPDERLRLVTPDEIREELKKFEDALGEMYFPGLSLARKRHEWRWLIEQHEQTHLVH